MSLAFDPQLVEGKWLQQLKIYSPLLPILGMPNIFTIFLFGVVHLDFALLCMIGAFLCLAGFFLTGPISSNELKRVRNTAARKWGKPKVSRCNATSDGCDFGSRAMLH